MIEMKRTTKDIRKMFQDRIQKSGPQTTSSAATTTTTAAGKPLDNKVSATTSKTNWYSVKQTDDLCVSPAVAVSQGVSVCVSAGTRDTETGRGGGAERGTERGAEGAKSMLCGQPDGVVVLRVKDDDDLPTVMSGKKFVSVSGMRETRSRVEASIWPDGADPGGDAAEDGGTGEEVQRVADADGGYEAGHKPRGCVEYSRNLSNGKAEGSSKCRRGSRGIQSQILLFEQLNQRSIEPGDKTENGPINHVGGGGRKRIPGVGPS